MNFVTKFYPAMFTMVFASRSDWIGVGGVGCG